MIIARVYIVRHGETEENKAGVIQGHLDTELNDTGRKQAELVAEALKDASFDFAYSSDLSRAVDTAQTILKYHPDVELVKAAELREKFMGVQQGLTIAERSKLDGAVVSASVESSQAFWGRLSGWWNTHIEQGLRDLPRRSTAYNVLVVSHGGAIGTILRKLLFGGGMECADGVGLWTPLLNTGVSIIEFGGDGPRRLVRHGDVSHLLGAKVVADNADVQ